MTPAGTPTDLRALLRRCGHAALATRQRDTAGGLAGWPAVSMVLIACDIDARPILLISQLAAHSRNIAEDNRVSLLCAPEIGADQPRVSVFGRLVPACAPDRQRRRYLSRHPDAARYADFGDFAFYQLDAEAAHWVGGFGKQRRCTGDALIAPLPDALIAAEPALTAEANHRLADRDSATARVGALDPEGVDLHQGARWWRVDFESPALSVAAWRETLWHALGLTPEPAAGDSKAK